MAKLLVSIVKGSRSIITGMTDFVPLVQRPVRLLEAVESGLFFPRVFERCDVTDLTEVRYSYRLSEVK